MKNHGSHAHLSAARRVTLSLVGECRRRDAHMRDLMRASERLDGLSAADRGLATRLALGVVATHGALDQAIDACLDARAHLEPRVRDALELATFELLYLQTPDAVAVSQGVELVRSASPHAAGLANAVLHRLAREQRPLVAQARERLLTSPAGCEARDLELAAGMPSWLAEQVLSSLGPAMAAELALCQLDPAPVFVAGNRSLHDAAHTRDLLARAGLEPEETFLPDSFLLARPAGLARSGLVGRVEAIPADLAAQMVALLVAPVGGGDLLEVGQGRGTKTLLVLDVLSLAGTRDDGARPRVYSIDDQQFKVDIARQRVAQGWDGWTRSAVADATRLAGSLPATWPRRYASVFVDAPCSGTGTMRRHPEIPWSLDPAAIDPANQDSLPALQLAMLQAAANCVDVGGVLTYATCSVLHQEDGDVVRAFLGSPAGRDFELASLSEASGLSVVDADTREAILCAVDEEGFWHTYPRGGSFDGHFCARLVRRRG